MRPLNSSQLSFGDTLLSNERHWDNFVEIFIASPRAQVFKRNEHGQFVSTKIFKNDTADKLIRAIRVIVQIALAPLTLFVAAWKYFQPSANRRKFQKQADYNRSNQLKRAQAQTMLAKTPATPVKPEKAKLDYVVTKLEAQVDSAA